MKQILGRHVDVLDSSLVHNTARHKGRCRCHKCRCYVPYCVAFHKLIAIKANPAPVFAEESGTIHDSHERKIDRTHFSYGPSQMQ